MILEYDLQLEFLQIHTLVISSNKPKTPINWRRLVLLMRFDWVRINGTVVIFDATWRWFKTKFLISNLNNLNF